MAGDIRRGEQEANNDTSIHLPVMSGIGEGDQGGLEVEYAVGGIFEGESGEGQDGGRERGDAETLQAGR